MHHELEIVDNDVGDVMDVAGVGHDVHDLFDRDRAVKAEERHG